MKWLDYRVMKTTYLVLRKSLAYYTRDCTMYATGIAELVVLLVVRQL